VPKKEEGAVAAASQGSFRRPGVECLRQAIGQLIIEFHSGKTLIFVE
jgi:hypothetical protein